MVLGILSIFIWPIAYIGLPVSTVGIASGVFSRSRQKSAMAVVGIILGAIGLGLTIVDLRIGLLDLILKTYFQV